MHYFFLTFLHLCSSSGGHFLWVTDSLANLFLPTYAEIICLAFFPLVPCALKVYWNLSSILCHFVMMMTWRWPFYWKNSRDGLHFLLGTVDPSLDSREALSVSSAWQLLVCLATWAVISKSHIWQFINSRHLPTYTLEKMSILFQQLKGKSSKAHILLIS